jgi:hypothetical protein
MAKIATRKANVVVINAADNLREQHGNYISEFVTRGNTVLYGLIADMHKVYEDIMAMPVVEKEHTLNKMRVYLKDECNIKTQKNTSELTTVLRYITLGSRKTICVYGAVIKKAIAEGVAADALAGYIENNGGIEKVRHADSMLERRKLNSEKEEKRNRYAKKHLAAATPMFSLSKPGGGSFVLRNRMAVDYTVAICRQGKGGKLEVMSTLPTDEVMENLVLQRYAECLALATFKGSADKFSEACEALGVHPDYVYFWKKDNGIVDADVDECAIVAADREQLKVAA